MSEIIAAVWFLMIGGYIGFGLAAWGHKRSTNPTHQLFASEMIGKAKKLLVTRKLVGSGPSITHDTFWTIEGVGNFRLTIAEASPVEESQGHPA